MMTYFKVFRSPRNKLTTKSFQTLVERGERTGVFVSFLKSTFSNEEIGSPATLTPYDDGSCHTSSTNVRLRQLTYFGYNARG